jgi:UDP-N-acetylmuramoyl-L-alanine---L-glutamate ligase
MNGQSIQEVFEQLFGGKKIVILGFGREGQSTYRAFCRYLPMQRVVVADAHPIPGDFNFQQGLEPLAIFTGDDYLSNLDAYDCVVKSPGISFSKIISLISPEKVYSQAGIFISAFRNQIIGITGTKGKSTTSTMLYRILHATSTDTVFVGNIGVPPLDMADIVGPDTHIVYELSSHQLEHLTVSPHIAIFLNVFQEHLDHYASYYHYQQAKFNIAKWQETGDFLIYNADNEVVNQWVGSHELTSQKVPLTMSKNLNPGFVVQHEQLRLRLNGAEIDFSNLHNNRKLPGVHNLWNIMAAAAAAYLKGVSEEQIA